MVYFVAGQLMVNTGSRGKGDESTRLGLDSGFGETPCRSRADDDPKVIAMG